MVPIEDRRVVGETRTDPAMPVRPLTEEERRIYEAHGRKTLEHFIKRRDEALDEAIRLYSRRNR